MTNPRHKGMSAEALMALHPKRIELVRQCANESSEAEFQRKWFSVLSRSAEWFSSMPLTPELHREPGGAFRATVETAFYAMRLAGGQKFAADLTSEKRRRLEPQYNYAVFLAAVCSALDEPFRHFEVTRLTDQSAWNPAAHGAFAPWIENGEYTVHRRELPLKVERMRTAMFAQTVITQELLAGFDTPVLADLFGAINPEKTPQGFEALVHKVVRQAVDVSQDFERKAQKGVFAPVKFDVPSAVHVALELQPQPVQAASTAPAPAQHAAPAAAQAAVASTLPLDLNESIPPSEPVSTDPPAGGTAAGSAPPRDPSGPQLSRTLLEALQRSEDEATRAAAVPVQPSRAVDPSMIAASSEKGGEAQRAGPTNEELEAILGPGSVMLREFFRALAGDVAEGKAKISWDDKGLVLQKRLVGGYGVTSDTLIEQLKKRSLLLRAHGNEICIVERAGRLIQERPVS
jgi:conjugal transfer pilus assembly protein TraI